MVLDYQRASEWEGIATEHQCATYLIPNEKVTDSFVKNFNSNKLSQLLQWTEPREIQIGWSDFWTWSSINSFESLTYICELVFFRFYVVSSHCVSWLVIESLTVRKKRHGFFAFSQLELLEDLYKVSVAFALSFFWPHVIQL